MAPQIITTVVTAAAASAGGNAYDLTTLAIIKDELGITGSGTDVRLRRYLTGASVAAAQFCNRVFVVETVKDEVWPQRDPYPYLIPGGLMPLQLTRWPIVAASVSSVIENSVTLVDGTDFRVDYDKGQLARLNATTLYPRRWPAWPISAQYDGGFDPIPPDVVDAVIRMVRTRWLAKDRDALLREENIPGVREAQYWIATGEDAGNMTPDVIDLLNNYRLPVIA